MLTVEDYSRLLREREVELILREVEVAGEIDRLSNRLNISEYKISKKDKEIADLKKKLNMMSDRLSIQNRELTELKEEGVSNGGTIKKSGLIELPVLDIDDKLYLEKKRILDMVKAKGQKGARLERIVKHVDFLSAFLNLCERNIKSNGVVSWSKVQRELETVDTYAEGLKEFITDGKGCKLTLVNVKSWYSMCIDSK